MNGFTDSLRGVGFKIHQRDRFTCQYCGADGTKSFETWLTLSCDHLLPRGHPNRDDPEYIVTACQFCNTADNRYFDYAQQRELDFEGKTREELIAQRWHYVQLVRNRYKNFWQEHVNAT